MAGKNDKRKKKKAAAAAAASSSNSKSNGNRQNFIFNSCVNCEIPLDNGTTKVAEFMLSFSESKRTFSVLEALTSVFELTTDLDQEIFPILTTKNLVMCPQCATVLASLYKSYVELMQMSKGTANICKLIRKAEVWHERKGEILLNSSMASNEVDEEEEDSESDSDAEYDKKVSSMIKQEVVQGSSRNGTKKSPAAGGKKNAKKTPAKSPKGKAKKIAKTENGEGFDFEGYEDDENDKDYGPKRKTPSRGRSRNRDSQDSTGGRKRIRRRPSQTRDDDYKCHECDRTFKFECRLIKHAQSHTDEKRQLCNQCDRTFIYTWMLENHILGDHQHQVPNECNICGLSFFRDDIFKNHYCTPKDQQEAEREIKPHWCRLCGKSFSKLAHLTLHLRSHEDDKPLKCPSCTLRFKYVKCLEKHMIVHDQEFPCSVCKQTFSQKSKLRSHMQIHHTPKTPKAPKKTPIKAPVAPSESEGKNSCPNCNRAFGRKNDMNRHLKKRICFVVNVKVEKDDEGGGGKVGAPSPFPEGYDSEDEYYPKPSSDEEEIDDVSDADSMSACVSDDDNHSIKASPSSPPHNIDLSEESSNSPVSSPKAPVPQDDDGDNDEDSELIVPDITDKKETKDKSENLE